MKNRSYCMSCKSLGRECSSCRLVRVSNDIRIAAQALVDEAREFEGLDECRGIMVPAKLILAIEAALKNED